MGFSLFNKVSKRKETVFDKRRADRHQTNALSCHLGGVQDISATGMKLNCEGKPPVKIGQVIDVKLNSGSHRIPVRAQVVWIKRRGFKTFTIGLRFVNIKKSLQAAIESMGMFGFIDLEAVAQQKKQKYGDPYAAREKKRIEATVNLPDYYGILNVASDVSAGEIQQAFRTLARKYHPDVADSAKEAAMFVKISEAYDVLHDAAKRKTYDLRRAG